MKYLVANSGGLDSALMCRKLQEDGHEVHSVFFNSHSLGYEEQMVAAAETANRFCNSHKVIEINWGYTPNHYENTDNFLMYDEAHKLYNIQYADVLPENPNEGDAYEVPVDGGEKTVKELYVYEGGWVDKGRLLSGPPNMGMIIMAMAVSYAKTLGINDVCGGFAGTRSPDMYAIYNQSADANLSLKWRPKYTAPYGPIGTEDALLMTGYSREDFPWVAQSVIEEV